MLRAYNARPTRARCAADAKDPRYANDSRYADKRFGQFEPANSPDKAMLSNLQSAKNYLAALERGADNETLAGFLSPDLSAEIFPNRLHPAGVTRDYAALLAAHEQNRQLFVSQRFEIRRTMASGDTIAIEYLWSGTTAKKLDGVPAGTSAGTSVGIAAGIELRAQVALFLEFRGGRIIRQRTYDSYFSFG